VSTAGKGEYLIRTKAKFPSKVAMAVAAPGSVEFGAVAGAVLAAAVKPASGSAAVPSFSELTGRFGPVALPAPKGRGKAAAVPGSVIAGLALPWSGTYQLAVANAGAAGQAAVAIGIKTPKARHFWYLGPIDPPSTATIMANRWRGSGHNDAQAEAFRHWDADGEIPVGCARCHSSYGYQDFVGADGTPNNQFDNPANPNAPAALGSTVDCDACHSPQAIALDTVVFPSGQVAVDLGAEARCMQCHQGRESTVSLDAHIDGRNPVDDDTVTAGLSFRNIHYFAAGVTLYGGGAKGAYQYRDGEADAKLYDGLNPHVPEANVCVECHDPHTLEVRISSLCIDCHRNGAGAPVATVDDLKQIRMAGSPLDYDGDGNATEGMYYELSTMADVLYAAIQQYATTVVGTGIVYNPASYPYFFTATGARFTTWTPRLLRACYNYQYWQKDPGAFAHNPKYMLQILFDSIEDLAATPKGKATIPVPELANMHRSDEGHFDGQAEAFRRWDTEDGIYRGTVQASCATCHSPEGFNFRAMYGMDITVPALVSDGLECGTCHVGGDFGQPVPALKVVTKVDFPGSPLPTTITNTTKAPDTSFICMTCHRGRESMSTLDADIAARAAAGQRPRFRNIHYLPAGATLYGKDAKVAYMFGPAASYNGKWAHDGGDTAQCKYCHLPSHTFAPEFKTNCGFCHPEAGGDLEHIRKQRATDYNGVNGTTDTLKAEVGSFEAALYAAIQAYAVAHGLDPIVYNDATYPYWFKAAGGSYTTWDATMVRAAFNYQWSQKEPGAWAHNTLFLLQVLYDSIDMLDDGVLNTSVPTLVRPPAP
jgi:hypothetical protein